MASAAAIKKAIRESELTDDELAEIGREAFVRRQKIATLKSRQIEVGDVVQLRRVKPKYLDGETGVLMERMVGGKMRVKLDHPTGRFADTVVVHLTCVEPLDAA